MKVRRTWAWLAILALVLAACANEGGGGSEEPSEADESEPAAESQPAESADAGEQSFLERAEAGEFEGTTVDILAQWVEAEADNFEGNFADFEERTGIDINYEGVTDYTTVLNVRVEGGDAPDIAQIAQPGLMRSLQADGHLVNLSEFMDVDQLREDYIESFIDLASVDGDLYGLYYKADLKSIVWYPNAAFEEAGYEIPETWDDLLALMDQIKADGGTPWCITQEHGEATGWVTTDWVEDVLLRTAPLETYDAWVAHEIPFDDPAVVNAANIVGEIFFGEGNVYGGPTAINATFVGDAQNPMFAEGGPDCWLHKQAAWIPSFWPADESTDPPTPLYEPGVDSSFFYLPPIDEEYGRPVLGGGDMLVMFDDRPEVRAVMEFFATPEAAEYWTQAGGFVSPNKDVPDDWYTTYPSSGLAEILAGADALRFDASDTMPAEVGAGTFWSGMVDWIANNGASTEEVLAEIEASWP
ncbi:MAG TPA: ABC transporter substrate-binding protein [Candidatus Limnocylindria bacterium]|nr:ABC transporter substrate-binding protein [Candidatus Limnocylindria bacterium]